MTMRVMVTTTSKILQVEKRNIEDLIKERADASLVQMEDIFHFQNRKRREEETRTKAKPMFRVPRMKLTITTVAIRKRKRAMIKRTHQKKCPRFKNAARMITRPRLEIITVKNEL